MLAIFPRRRRHPDSGEPFDPFRPEVERGEREDERLLEVAAVLLNVLPVPPQVEDRVADELARPVVRGLAAAVRLADLDVGALRHVYLAGSVRRPSVITGGCSRSSTVSGSSPLATPAATSR
jgi:hypothetical protein